MIETLFTLLVSFSKIGLISLGGGNAMLKLLEVEAVNYRHWVGQDEFINMLGTSFFFPGLTGIKLAALIGYKVAGVFGLLVAVVALNLPGLLLAFLGYQWLTHHNGPTTQKIMVGVQYGALALLASACFSIGQSIFQLNYSLVVSLLSVVFFIGLTFFNLSPFWGFLVFIGICFWV